ncbi:hypothetical protein SDC9_162737 [bioreactor metagenome]|uniref:Uncharacterized protein n=1 Tax=bioreactor metagenome TaxID=1076179 RepID=A0A645FLX6_9ZZZZ
MRAEEGRGDVYRQLLRYHPVYLKLAHLTLDVEAVTAFALQRRRTAQYHFPHSPGGLFVKLFYRQAAGGGQRHHDPHRHPPALQLIKVVGLQPGTILFYAGTAEDHMCVAVDESRHDDLAGGVDDLRRRVDQRRYLISAADGRYQAIAHRDGAVFYKPDAVRRALFAGQ